MDYFGIIKKAFKINLKNRFLWIFGILAGGTAGISGFNYNMDQSALQNTWTRFSNQSTADFDMNVFWANHGTTVIVLLIILLLLSLIFFVLNLISQGALIISINRLESGEKTDFYKSFKKGAKSFWRIWAFNITMLLAMLIVLSAWIIPTCLLVISGNYLSAVVVGLLLLFLNIVFWILVALLTPYALRIVVLRRLTVFQSIRQSLHFVRENLAEVFVTYLLLAAISFVVGVAVLLVAAFLVGVLALIGYAIFLASLGAALAYGLIVTVALLVAIIIFSGAYSSFSSTVLTITYLKLIDRA